MRGSTVLLADTYTSSGQFELGPFIESLLGGLYHFLGCSVHYIRMDFISGVKSGNSIYCVNLLNNLSISYHINNHFHCQQYHLQLCHKRQK